VVLLREFSFIIWREAGELDSFAEFLICFGGYFILPLFQFVFSHKISFSILKKRLEKFYIV